MLCLHLFSEKSIGGLNKISDFPFASYAEVFCGGPIPDKSPSWTVFENWHERTRSVLMCKSDHVLMKILQNQHTLSFSVMNRLFPVCLNWNLSFSSFSFLVLTTQHEVSGISRQKKWSHVSAFQTFQHCGCFQHFCSNEQPEFVI